MEINDVKIGDWVKDISFPHGEMVGFVTKKGLALVQVQWTCIFYKNGNCVALNNSKGEISDNLELFNDYKADLFKNDMVELALSIKNKSLFDCVFKNSNGENIC